MTSTRNLKAGRPDYYAGFKAYLLSSLAGLNRHHLISVGERVAQCFTYVSSSHLPAKALSYIAMEGSPHQTRGARFIAKNK